MANREVFILIWLDETEEWKYFKDSFNPDEFPNGYVDYQIVVENGVIVEDTFNDYRVGQPFDLFYSKAVWDKNEEKRGISPMNPAIWETCSKCGNTFEDAQACYEHHKECKQ